MIKTPASRLEKQVRMSAWSEWSKESKTVEGGQTREWFNCLVQSSDVIHEAGSRLNSFGLLLHRNPFHTCQVVTFLSSYTHLFVWMQALILSQCGNVAGTADKATKTHRNVTATSITQCCSSLLLSQRLGTEIGVPQS